MQKYQNSPRFQRSRAASLGDVLAPAARYSSHAPRFFLASGETFVNKISFQAQFYHHQDASLEQETSPQYASTFSKYKLHSNILTTKTV